MSFILLLKQVLHLITPSAIRAFRIRTCGTVAGQDAAPPKQEGEGSFAPGELEDKEGADSISSPVTQLIDATSGDATSQDLNTTSVANSEPQIGWVEQSQLAAWVTERIPVAELSDSQQKACAPPPVQGQDIPAGAPIGSDSTP